MTIRQCSEDLLALRRAGRLSADAAKALDSHLQTCASCGVEAVLHDELEREGQPRAGDERLIAMAVERAMTNRARRQRRQARPWVIAVTAALVFLAAGSLSSAGIWIYRQMAVSTPAANPVSRAEKAKPVAMGPRAAAPVAATEPVALEADPPPRAVAPQPSHPAPAERPRVIGSRAPNMAPPPAVPARPSDVAALFAAANEARRAGDTTRAVRLYADVQLKFPGTREAKLSFVSFGRMLLDQDHPAEALSQFDSYLRGTPNDVLAAEALYGRARALTALRRAQDARRAWADLLARFPDSVYADLARRQLGGQTRE